MYVNEQYFSFYFINNKEKNSQRDLGTPGAVNISLACAEKIFLQ